jgi:hypothetical protein
VSSGDLGERSATVAAQREEGNEHDRFAAAVVDHVLVAALGETVVVLNGCDREDCSGSLDLVDADL